MDQRFTTPIMSKFRDDWEVNDFVLVNNSSILNDTPPVLNIATTEVPLPSLVNNSNNGTNYPSVEIDTSSKSPGEVSDGENVNDLIKLKNIRLANVNRLAIGQLNINSLRNKFEALSDIVKGNLDILILTETKLDETFPKNQFLMDGFCPPFRFDRNGHGGEVMMYVREDIPCKFLKKHSTAENIEGIFLEINLRKSKWLHFGGCNPKKDNISNFLNQLGQTIDEYMAYYDNLLVVGNFNAEISESNMEVL